MKILWQSSVLALTLLAFVAAFFGLTNAHDQPLSLINDPSLQLHVILTGDDMQLHGASVFDVFARPVVSEDGTSVHYDGFTTFVHNDVMLTYMLVDGVSYMIKTVGNDTTAAGTQTARCIAPALPFDSILQALNKTQPLTSAADGEFPIECQSGSLFQTSFGNDEFVLCASGDSELIAYGRDITVGMQYMETPIRNISAPVIDDKNSFCDANPTPVPINPTALALLTGRELLLSVSRSLKASAIEAESCACKSKPRPCILLHGLGNPNEEEELQDTPESTKEKFGDIGDHAPCCTTVKNVVLNTVDYGWIDDTLQQKFCDHSLSMSSTSDLESGTISDTIVVTHSMGGLVMSMALATGKCKFDESTSWPRPLRKNISGVITTAFTFLFPDQCPPSEARKSISYQNEKYSTPQLNAAYVAAQEAYRGNVTAAMCSKSYSGVISKFFLSCIVSGSTFPHKSRENDGLVEFQSCLGGLDPAMFGDSYLDRFYAPKLNHADTAFLTRDGFFKNSQKPFKWFECLL